MLRIRCLKVGQLQTNCYLIISGGEVLIIDPGDDADYIQRIIADEPVEPKMIVATHGHYDHVLAVTELKLAYKIPFLMHKEDEFLLKRMRSSAAHFGRIKTDPPPKIDKYLKENDQLTINDRPLTIIATSGHTPGSISLYSKEAKVVFVGDVMFAGGGIGRTDFAYSDQPLLLKSINKLLKLPRDIKVYCGHGEETIIRDLRKYLTK